MIEIEGRASTVVLEAKLLAGAPFSWVFIVIVFGTQLSKPRFGRVSRDGDLPVTVAVPMDAVYKRPREETCVAFGQAASTCLLAVAARIGADSDDLRRRLSAAGLLTD